ncbi:ThuA domain-containing protein [Streptomyces aidingensis]|uniref:Glucose/arabinose dehydrogenase, beta-propeller fold n=1 Tax=Streptomyces aidingensis TaxID=910347 RepID=A0A1I1UMW5_9ACTN|nr:ThuA domain-containing protein [Streptomyces aidingensis]SFD72171.1 Glucose/arabinose dehydrogenase, beta-propeller fold [Streptomyces aidingensis]
MTTATRPARPPSRRTALRVVAAVLTAALALLVPGLAAAHPGHGDETFNALVFSKTAAFRHGSIEAGVAAIEALGAEHGFDVTATEDASVFNDEDLAQYEVVIWLSTTGDVLNDSQQAAFERYIRAGGGYAGVHAAADTEYDWAWYGELVGAYFSGHPAPQQATVKVEDPAHPSTAGLPVQWERTDEWYDYRTNPRGDVHVLASLDESTYSGGTMGAEHPISWCQIHDGGRSWYTGMGHDNASFSDPLFLDHLLGGIRSAAGVAPSDCGASLTGSYEKVVLDDNTSNPMELAIADDGRVFYIDRNGEVRVVRTDGTVVTAGTVPVYTGQEFGLLGVALDPGFAENNLLYLYYSPAGTDPVDRVSRFTVNGDSLDLASEEVLLEIDVQRQECCHAGGALEFDSQGNLYITTGDNTNPFASDGYAPLDERPGRAAWDAQRTSANSNSLSGKILRITPQPDGGYTVPEGNLFPPGTADTRPEIYAMGFRNPFRIGIDPTTDRLYVADYGPDAGSSNPDRGPDGRVEWNIVDEPGFYGWPYCVGDNTPYHEYDFATGTSGQAYDCAAPVNDSPNNTGITELPAAIPAELWMGKSASGVPEIGGSGAPMTSGAYAFDPDLDSGRKWPAYFDGKAVFADWNDGRLFSVQPDAERTGVADVSRMLEGMEFARPHALQFGPDGALYVIEWGSGFGGNNADSGVYRVDYVQGNRAPIARFTADRTSGPLPLEVAFDSAGSYDPDGQPVTFSWDFDGDGTPDSTDPAPSHTYTEAGRYTARLTVTDSEGRSAVSNLDITAGNTAPVIEVAAPLNGGFFEFGDTIRYEVAVTDPDGGPVDCQDVVVQPGLGHDEHSHGYEQYHGCTGTFPLPGDEGHIGANIFGTVTVTYTDQGNGDAPPLTTQEVLVLQPKHREAEHFDATGRLASSTAGGDPGVQRETTGDTAGGGQNIGYIEDGDWWAWDPANLTGIEEIGLRAASPSAGATVEVRTGDPDTGPAVAVIEVAATGDWQVYGDFTAPVSGASATASGPLYFVKTTGQLNVNWVEFTGRGVTENQRPEVSVTADPVTGTAPLEVDFTAEATDPEGDSLEYAWTFGDGSTATGPAATHTYTQAGDYTARVTVTDARGARSSQSVAIDVSPPDALPVCLSGRSDGFDGTALDRDRWTEVVREDQDLAVRDGHLVLPLTNTDIYGTGNSGTPNIVLQELPDGAWEATAKITLEARLAYQQAGLIVYGDDDNYAKMVLQGRSTGDPSAANRIFQFIREEAGSPNEVGDSNTAALGADYPDTFWVRFTSDGENLRAFHSPDGTTFTAMPETKSLTGIDNPRIGLFALANRAEALPATAFVDHFVLTPDATATRPEPSDEFDGGALDTCRWSDVVRPDTGALAVADGALRIDTSPGDIYQGDATDPRNFVLQPAPEGDWTIETKVDASAFDERYQQAGLMVYADDTTYVKFDYLTTNAPGEAVGRAIELRGEAGDVLLDPAPNADPAPTQGVWHLRLTRNGDTYTGSYSADGETWTELPPVSNPALAEGTPRFGVYAFGAGQTASKPALFDYFRYAPVESDTTAPTVELTTDPAGPTGADGWWTTPVTVTATAEDDGDGEVSVEYRTDGGDWTAYTEPVTLSGDGAHTLEVRAGDAAGNVSEAVAAEYRIDTTAPAVSFDGMADGDALGLGDVVAADVLAEDAGSGVAEVAITLDGTPVTSPAQLDPAVLGLGEHVLAVTAADVAGNTAEVRAAFTVAADYDGAIALVERLVAEDRVAERSGDRLVRELTKAQRALAKGHDKQVGKRLDRFIRHAEDLPDEEVGELLLSVAEALREQL